MMGNVAHFHVPAPESDPQGGLAALVARMAGGDDRALERLFDLTNRRVFALAMQVAADRSLAEEATLDVYTQAWRQASRYEPSKGSPIGWLLSMARSRAIDLLRSRAKLIYRDTVLEDALAIPAPGPTPEDRSEDAQEARRIRRALMKVSKEQREALIAAYFGGLSHSEVATALGQPLGTVKTRIRTGLMLLRRLLTENGDSVP